MSDSNTSNWINDWQALQQQYWNAWNSSAGEGQKTATDQPDSDRPWAESVDAWWRSAGVPGDVGRNLSDQGRWFLDMGQDVLRQFTEFNREGDPAEAWNRAVQKWLEHVQTDQMGDWWSQPFEGFRRLATEMIGVSDKHYRQMLEQGDMEAGVRQQLDEWLSLPSFGYAREVQEHVHLLARSWLAHQAVTGAYRDQLQRVATATAEGMRARIGTLADTGGEIKSLRELFDLWVDVAEAAYAEVVSSREYGKVYGDLVNTMMVVRRETQKLTERAARHAGLPTRSELDTAHARIHELRREMRELKNRMGSEDKS